MPQDMLRVQLDDRALFLDRWRALLLQALRGAAAAGSTRTAGSCAGSSNDTWTGRASPESAAYRLVREFRQRVGELAFTPLFADVRKVDPAYPATTGRGGGGPAVGAGDGAAARTCCHRSSATGRTCCWRRRTAPSPTRSRPAGRSPRTPGAASTRPHPAPALARGAATGALARPACAALAGDAHMPRVQAAGLRGVAAHGGLAGTRGARATSTCPVGRAGTPCRRTTATCTRRG